MYLLASFFFFRLAFCIGAILSVRTHSHAHAIHDATVGENSENGFPTR